MKKKILSLLLCTVIASSFVACSSGESGSSTETSSISSSSSESSAGPSEPGQPEETSSESIAAEQTEKNIGEPVNANSEQKVSVDVLAGLVQATLEKDFPGCEVIYKDNVITANVWVDGLAAEMTVSQLSGTDNYNKSWDTAKNSTVNLSKSVCNFIDDMGQEDVYFNLNVLNDLNHDKVFLTILEDEILYDVLAETPTDEPEAKTIPEPASSNIPSIISEPSQSSVAASAPPPAQSSRLVPEIIGSLKEPDYSKTADNLKKSSSRNGSGNNFNTYDNADQQKTDADYVLNTSTMKFHKPTCADVKKIAEKNYSTFYGTRNEVIAAGYSACGHCKP